MCSPVGRASSQARMGLAVLKYLPRAALISGGKLPTGMVLADASVARTDRTVSASAALHVRIVVSFLDRRGPMPESRDLSREPIRGGISGRRPSSAYRVDLASM